jgi:hypothetical protein
MPLSRGMVPRLLVKEILPVVAAVTTGHHKGRNNMRTITLTLTAGMALGLLGIASAARADEIIVVKGDGHCASAPICAPAPVCAPAPCPTAQMICVTEKRPTTKVVYSSVCKNYCIPHCGLHCLFSSNCCGCGENTECQECGHVHTRHVLVKKFVPGCDVNVCVPKEVPYTPPCAAIAPACGTIAPAPAKVEPIPVKPAPAK